MNDINIEHPAYHKRNDDTGKVWYEVSACVNTMEEAEQLYKIITSLPEIKSALEKAKGLLVDYKEYCEESCGTVGKLESINETIAAIEAVKL